MVAVDTKAWDAEAFLATAELNSVKQDKANAERLAGAGESFIPIDYGGCVNFFEEKTCGECGGLENRLLLWTKAVVLPIVPALADDAMETYDPVVIVGVGKANISKITLSQGEVLGGCSGIGWMTHCGWLWADIGSRGGC
jgi:hypothetical protein